MNAANLRVGSDLGPVRQDGFVVPDLDGAIAFWVERLGIGPFWVAEGIVAEGVEYRGTRSRPAVSVALANAGPQQIELIQPLDEQPSIWRDHLLVTGGGHHHVAFWSRQFEIDCGRLIDAGLELVQRGIAGQDGRYAYLVSRDGVGPFVEVSEVSGWKETVFAAIARTAEAWTGEDPVRSLDGWPPSSAAQGGAER